MLSEKIYTHVFLELKNGLPKLVIGLGILLGSCQFGIDLIVTRPLIAHFLYTRLKPTCDKKIGIMGLVYIFNQ